LTVPRRRRRTEDEKTKGYLSCRTVARLCQIENKMDTALRYDLAATIPVVEQGATPRHGEPAARDDLRR
jgi:hypothetical protein